MRTAAVGFFVCLAAITTSMASAGSQIELRPIHLQTFYEIDKTGTATLRLSDSSPWYVLKNADWANSGVLKSGYVPVLHDSKQYYCLIKSDQKVGSRFPEKNLLCGDLVVVESLAGSNYRVTRILPEFWGPY